MVLGMARCGTSAITRGLQALGIDLGTQLAPADAQWNPTGFFEDNEFVYRINGRIFAATNFLPYSIHMPDRAKLIGPETEAIRKETRKLLTNRFANTHYWAFKDPNTIKSLPFWQSVLSEENIQPNYIIALRNPLSVAKSYQSLTGSALEVGLMLWLMYMLQAIDETAGEKRLIVSYEDILVRPVEELNRIKTFFCIPDLAPAENIELYATKFIDKSLHRHTDANAESELAKSALPLCGRVYDLLLAVAKDEVTLNEAMFNDRWQMIKSELTQIYPFICYMDIVLKKVNVLEKSLKRIHKSLRWRMSSPFRTIDYIWQSWKKKRKINRDRLPRAYG